MIIPEINELRRISKIEMYDHNNFEVQDFKNKYSIFLKLAKEEKENLLGHNNVSITEDEKMAIALNIIKKKDGGITKKEMKNLTELTDKEWCKFIKNEEIKFYGFTNTGRWFFEKKENN